jgi:hypothetical protein
MKILLVLVICLVAGCGPSGEKVQMEKFQHGNGLSFEMAGAIADIQETTDGYIFRFAPEDSRQANQLEVRYQAEKPANLEEKNIENQKIYFRESIQTGASGGEEKTLVLWKPVDNNKGIYVEHYRQSNNEFTFASTWTLMLNAQ